MNWWIYMRQVDIRADIAYLFMSVYPHYVSETETVAARIIKLLIVF